jgi:hypothetical protein
MIWGMTDQIDGVLTVFLQKQDRRSWEALVATGPAGAGRVLELWYGGSGDPLPKPAGMHDRELVEAWAGALGAAAAADPQAFVAAVAEREVGTIEVAILGGLDDARATRLLCEHARHRDWLMRRTAVAALGRHPESSARPCVERAIDDPEAVVRAAAIRSLSRWDRGQAIARFEELLTTAGPTPLLRAEIRTALRALRAGRAVPDHVL